MKKFFLSFYFVFMIGSVFANPISSNVTGLDVADRKKARAEEFNLNWIKIDVNPKIVESFQAEVDAAINGSAGMLKYLAFYMSNGALHNEDLFRREDVNPTPFIESIAVLAFVHALDNKDRYLLYDDEDSSSSDESEEAAIEVLRECCPKFSKEVGIIPQEHSTLS